MLERAWGTFQKVLGRTAKEMRDPRSGFAGFTKGFCTHDPSRSVTPGVIRVVGLLLCCACGASSSASNGASTVTSPAAAPPSAIASEPAAATARSLPLQYSAPLGCPSVDGYLSDVRARASNLTLEPIADAAPVSASAGADEAVGVRVEPAPEARGWLGRVTVAGPRALEREVRGERCEDVVAALALITVLRFEGGDSPERSGTTSVAAGGGATRPSAELTDATPGAATTAPTSVTSGEAPEPSSSAATAAGQPASAQPLPAQPLPVPPSSTRPVPVTEPEVTASPAPTSSAASGRLDAAPSPSARTPSSTSGEPEDPEADADGLAPDEGAPAQSSDERIASASRSSEPDLPGASGGEAPGDDAAETSDTSSASESETASSWEWPATSPAVAALAGYATVPSHAFRGALEGELRIGEGRSSWLSSLSLAYARGSDAVAPGDLGLTLLTLELALCPPSIIAESSLWISACASVRGGGVRLAFTSTLPDVEARDTWRPWVAVGPSLRVGVPLSEHWALRGVAELAVQLVRDTFAVRLGAADDPTADIMPLYRPEPLSIELGAGVGYSF